MKTKNALFTIIGAFIVLASVLSSCGNSEKVVSANGIQKRKYNKGWHTNISTRNSGEMSAKKVESDDAEKVSSKERENTSKELMGKQDAEQNYTAELNTGNDRYSIKRGNHKAHEEAEQKKAENCDVITLKNQRKIYAKILSMGEEKVTFKQCDYPGKTAQVINTSEVASIDYPDGGKNIFEEGFVYEHTIKKLKKFKPLSKIEEEPKIEIYSLLSFIFGITGALLLLLIGWPVLMGTAAVVLGIAGLSRFKNEEGKWKGKGFAIAGIIIGSLLIILFWIVVLLVVAFLAALT